MRPTYKVVDRHNVTHVARDLDVLRDELIACYDEYGYDDWTPGEVREAVDDLILGLRTGRRTVGYVCAETILDAIAQPVPSPVGWLR